MGCLYVAGDSFASLAYNQPLGNSWTEILAKKLDLELVNAARPAASNLSIAIQLDWITNRVTTDDFTVIFLTDNYRKTMVDLGIEEEPRGHLLEYHSLHEQQRKSDHIDYHPTPKVITATFLNAVGEMRDFYKTWFDVDFQSIEDSLLLTGAFTKLNNKTSRFLVCSGGIDNHVYESKPRIVDHTTFCIKQENYFKLPSKVLLNMTEKSAYINHLDDITHSKIATILHSKVRG